MGGWRKKRRPDEGHRVHQSTYIEEERIRSMTGAVKKPRTSGMIVLAVTVKRAPRCLLHAGARAFEDLPTRCFIFAYRFPVVVMVVGSRDASRVTVGLSIRTGFQQRLHVYTRSKALKTRHIYWP